MDGESDAGPWCGPQEWRPQRREIAGLIAGAALGAEWPPLLARPRAGPVALWAADRAGHGVFGLDADGFVALRTTVVAPERVSAAPGGACFVDARPGGRRDGPRARWLVRADGSISPVERPRSASSATLEGWEDALGAHELPIVAATRSRPAGSRRVWVLRSATSAGASRLERWSRGPDRTWRRAFLFVLEFSARALAGARGDVWVVGDRVPRVLLATRRGRVVLSRTLPDLDGADALLSASRASGGGVWIAAGGAIARLDRTGRRLPGQGGFRHVVSLAPALG
ncbi:MAG: hypothetical protein AAF957_00260 [Planctomycetota bacterium]